jgi:hypothetical protein
MLYDDLYQYDPLSATMTNLTETGVITGTPPTPRMAHGFVAAGGELYVFGGTSLEGTANLICIPPYSILCWETIDHQVSA